MSTLSFCVLLYISLVLGLADDTINALADLRDEPGTQSEDTEWVNSDDIGMDVEALPALPDHMTNEESIVYAIRDYIDNLYVFFSTT